MEPEEPKELGAAPLWAEASKRQEQAPWHYYWQSGRDWRVSYQSGEYPSLRGYPLPRLLQGEINGKFLHPVEFCQLGLSEFTLGILECSNIHDMDFGLNSFIEKC